MKRIFAVIGSVMLLFAQAACGGNGQDQSSTEAPPSSIQKETESAGQTNTGEAISGAEYISDMTGELKIEAVGKSPTLQPTDNTISEDNTVTKMNVQVGDSTFAASLESNSAVDALIEMMQNAPVTISMRDYSGFEKVGPLGTGLPASNSQTTTQTGDIVLYNGNQIVIFYGSNSWSYTRLGKINDLSGWEEALGSGDVTVTFSVD